MAENSISILGCGWMGLPLAQHLNSKDWTVRGSTTTEEKLETLEQAGITPCPLTLDPELTSTGSGCDSFWQSEILFLNIPPGRRDPGVEERFPTQIKSVLEQVEQSPIQWIIFAGSTSVYPSSSKLVEETDASRGDDVRASGRAIMHAEDLLHSTHGFDTTILRFGGLYGYDRHPANYLKGKKNLKNGSAPVNLIHRDDCIQIIDRVLEEDIRGEIYNCVSDGHPPRCEFYKAAADVLRVEPPTFDKSEDGSTRTKIVSNKKLKQHLNYTFRHPNPMDL